MPHHLTERTCEKEVHSACPDGDSASLNKLSKAMRDSPRRVFLNSTTQDRTPWDDLFRRVAALSPDRVSGTLRSACLMSLIARIVFVFAMSDSPIMKTRSRRNRRRSRARTPHGSSAETLRGRRERYCSPLWPSGRYSGAGSHWRCVRCDLCGLV
jgi:hypothetical protein